MGCEARTRIYVAGVVGGYCHHRNSSGAFVARTVQGERPGAGFLLPEQRQANDAAVFLYASDNHEFFPPNPDDGNTVPGYNWCPGNSGIGQAEEFNPDVLLDQTRSLLITYLAGNASLYRCPADLRMGLYQGTNVALLGKTVPAVRTFSMSQAVGTIDPGYDETGPGTGRKRPNITACRICR